MNNEGTRIIIVPSASKDKQTSLDQIIIFKKQSARSLRDNFLWHTEQWHHGKFRHELQKRRRMMKKKKKKNNKRDDIGRWAISLGTGRALIEISKNIFSLPSIDEKWWNCLSAMVSARSLLQSHFLLNRTSKFEKWLILFSNHSSKLV